MEECVASAKQNELSECCGQNKFTLFHLLVWHNFYDAVKGVLERKVVNPDITDGNGKGVTALMLACNRANLQMVKLLLDNGADDKLADVDGRNCFHYLTCLRVGLSLAFTGKQETYHQRALIAKLLKHGINDPDKEGKTPLVMMLIDKDADISYSLIDAFIEKGADCGFVDEDGDTLLHIAIKNRHLTSALRLMNRENVNAANKAGQTPLKIAEAYHLEGLCIALKDKGAVCDNTNERINLKHLTTMASNAFAYGNEIDGLGIALFLAEKIIKSVDTDEDDEVKCIADMFCNALNSDESCSILDMCVASKISLTEKFTYGGRAWCLRDECFSIRYGLKAVEKLAELKIDLKTPIVDGRTPANIIAGLDCPTLFSNERCT
ncbi:MAG: hypothetical protein K2G96_03245, partial [Clostridia bacterium]|nr:hypothetical protein [Clostridia bacterium]